MITKDVKNSIEESVLCWLATSDSDGNPNCSPKEIFTYNGDNEIIIANIASPESVKNIEYNPSVCVSFVHVFKQKGFKIKGAATYIDPSNPKFDDYKKLIVPMAGELFPVKGVIVVNVVSVAPILAPSYFLIAGQTEEAAVKSAKSTYCT